MNFGERQDLMIRAWLEDEVFPKLLTRPTHCGHPWRHLSVPIEREISSVEALVGEGDEPDNFIFVPICESMEPCEDLPGAYEASTFFHLILSPIWVSELMTEVPQVVLAQLEGDYDLERQWRCEWVDGGGRVRWIESLREMNRR